MKKIISICLLLICLKSAQAQLNLLHPERYFIYTDIFDGKCPSGNDAVDGDWEKLNGKVKNVKEIYYTKGNRVIGEKIQNAIQFIRYFKYNEQGDLIEYQIKMNIEQGIDYFDWEDKDKFTSNFESKIPSLKTNFSYVYNKNGLIIEMYETGKDDSGVGLNKISFIYNANQVLKEEDSYCKDSIYNKQVLFNYNGRNITSLKVNIPHSEPHQGHNEKIINSYQYMYSYTQDACTLKQFVPNYNDTYNLFTFKKGVLVNAKYFEHNKLKSYNKDYRTNNNMDIIEAHSYSGTKPDILLRYKYLKYDQKGNWIERKVYQVLGSELSENPSVVRKIEYYK